MKQRLLNDEMLHFQDNNGCGIYIWHNERNRYCFEFEGKILLSTKTFKPIQNKLDSIDGLIEIIEQD